MSIKIFDGLKIRISDIGKFIKIFDKRCLDFLEKQTRELMKGVKPERLLKSSEDATGLRGDLTPEQFLEIPAASNYFRFIEIAKLYIKSMDGGYNVLNPECWFNAFVYRDSFLIVPGYPTGLRYPKYPKYVEDFSYWNNTDPPDGMTWNEFSKRGDIWKKAGALDIPFNNRLTHMLIDREEHGKELVLLENRILTEKVNGKRMFSASCVAWLQLEDEKINSG